MREILVELLNTGIKGSLLLNEYGKEKVDLALSQIREELRKKVRELKKLRYLSKKNLAQQMSWIDGHKVGIDEVLKIIDELT